MPDGQQYPSWMLPSFVNLLALFRKLVSTCVSRMEEITLDAWIREKVTVFIKKFGQYGILDNFLQGVRASEMGLEFVFNGVGQ